MRILGIDPGSKLTGLARVVYGQPTEVWTYAPEGSNFQERLFSYYEYIHSQIEEQDADMVVVELVAVVRNLQTVRILTSFEAATILAAKSLNRMAIQARVTQARKVVFGDGSMSKDTAWLEGQKKWPHLTLLKKNSGGTDQIDAAVLGVAGPRIAEGK